MLILHQWKVPKAPYIGLFNVIFFALLQIVKIDLLLYLQSDHKQAMDRTVKWYFVICCCLSEHDSRLPYPEYHPILAVCFRLDNSNTLGFDMSPLLPFS